MEPLTDKDVEIVLERIIENYDAVTVVSEVFTDVNSQAAFIEGLQELCPVQEGIPEDQQIVLKVGGSRIRELQECVKVDFSRDVRKDAENLEQDPHLRRVFKPLIPILKNYPEERMTKPDLDFFIWNSNADEIMRVFSEKGFKVSKHTATGDVWVIEIRGENGSTTFVDANMSFQTGDGWPMFGFKATFKSEPEPSFDLDISAARLHVYPLALPGIHVLEPLDPKRVAVVGRALLWAVTALVKSRDQDPDSGKVRYERVRPPAGGLVLPYYDTVHLFPLLLNLIEQGVYEEVQYRSGLRDMALFLRLIAGFDSEYAFLPYGFSLEMGKFLMSMKSEWYHGRYKWEKRSLD
jgi:hypothetical protein